VPRRKPALERLGNVVVAAARIAIMQGYLVASWPEQDWLQVVEEHLLGEAWLHYMNFQEEDMLQGDNMDSVLEALTKVALLVA
jgi:hypothetical protein